MPQDLKAAILAALQQTNDPGLKSVLGLLLQALDHIGGLVEDVHRDLHRYMESNALDRQELFNGHIDAHADHHHWVAGQIDAGRANRVELRSLVFDLLKAAILAGAAWAAGFFMGR